jgi:hypothetical protein
VLLGRPVLVIAPVLRAAAPFRGGCAAVRLFAGVVVADQFDEDVSGCADSLSGEAAQFLEVLPLPCRLDEDVDRVAVAGLGEPAQLVEITTFSGQFDELVLRVAVTAGRGLVQPGEVAVGARSANTSVSRAMRRLDC